MNFSIKRATIDDLVLLQRLFYNTIVHDRSYTYSKSEIDYWVKHASDKAYWQHKFIHSYFFVATLNKEIIGFISMDDTGMIEYVFINSMYRKQGVALQLYNYIEQTAIKNGMERIRGSVHLNSMPFFENLGFRLIKEYQNEDNDTKYMIEKPLRIYSETSVKIERK